MTLHPSAVDLYARSSAFFRQCDELLDAECGFVETGSIILAGPEKEDVLLKAVQFMAAAGVKVDSLTLDELARLEPAADLDGLTAASYAPHAGYADPVLTTQAFAGAAKRFGVQIQQGQTVTGLILKGRRITGVETTGGFIETPVVIVAAGAWSGEILRPIGIELAVQPVRHPVVCLRRPEGFGPPHHSLLDLMTGIYARPEAGELSLAGSIDHQIGYDPTNPDGGMGYVEDDYILWTMERLLHRYPALYASELCKGWAGVMTISPDWQPIIGGWPDVPGLYSATGFSGRGFQISPSAGDLLAGLVTGDDSAAALLEPFSPSRFEEGLLMPANWEGKTFGLLG
jgi:glycine/D-amino acid oxidase-like deaminating enzyme